MFKKFRRTEKWLLKNIWLAKKRQEAADALAAAAVEAAQEAAAAENAEA